MSVTAASHRFPAPEPDPVEPVEAVPAQGRHVGCPQCGQRLWVREKDAVLPEHLLPAKPFSPFTPEGCPASGAPVASAAPAAEPSHEETETWATVLSLPAGLDWRLQPFSHLPAPRRLAS